MSSDATILLKTVLIRIAAALALVIGLGASSGARAEDHFFSLSEIFPLGKCSPVIPNFELMISKFAGGELTEHRIHDGQGEVVEVISSLVNKDRDQWVIVGLKTETQVIFCLYASGIGQGSVDSRTINTKGR